MQPLLLTGLLALVAKNLVELLKHLANVGGSEDSTYTRKKGLYALMAPVGLAALAALAQHQGVALDLLGQLGVHGGDETWKAIFTGIVAGFAAPEAYDVQNLLKAKVSATTTATANVAAYIPQTSPVAEPAVDDAGDPS